MKKISLILFAVMAVACSQAPQLTKSGINPDDFISERDGEPVALYTLSNSAGMEVCITNYGGRIVSWMAPDKDGGFKDIVFGFSKIDDYYIENNDTNWGAALGRYANRIDGGKLEIDGVEYQLVQNDNGLHCLHGGEIGWLHKVYSVEEYDSTHLKLKMFSPDGDSGFPGNVTAYVTYTLKENNALDIDYEATTDAPTVINMSNHSYFNLSGDPVNYSILEHELYVNADYYTPVNDVLIPAKMAEPVEGTPMDFRQMTLVGARIGDDYEQLVAGNGYDHNWVIKREEGDGIIEVARMLCPKTGIQLSVWSYEPGLQVYSGNFLDGTIAGRYGAYPFRSAMCLETQHYPDSPHHQGEWPNVVLRPGETYKSFCEFKLDVVTE